MPRIVALPPVTEALSASDTLAMHNASSGDTEKVTVEQVRSHISWTPAEETWSYSSWSSTTRIGVITVPTDATAKYSAGMRIRISQSTGGTKYGIIVAVSATTLTVFFPSGTTLNNETISNPYWSCIKVPYGFNPDPTQWQIVLSDTANQTKASPAAGTWYNQGSLSIVLGIGAWNVRFRAYLNAVVSGTNSGANATLSTADNSQSDDRFSFGLKNSTGITQHGVAGYQEVDILLAAQTTYYINIQATSGSNTSVALLGTLKSTRVTATIAYL